MDATKTLTLLDHPPTTLPLFLTQTPSPTFYLAHVLKRSLLGTCTTIPDPHSSASSTRQILQCTYPHHWYYYAFIGVSCGMLTMLILLPTLYSVWKNKRKAMFAVNPAAGAASIGIGLAGKAAGKMFSKKARLGGYAQQEYQMQMPPQAYGYGYREAGGTV